METKQLECNTPEYEKEWDQAKQVQCSKCGCSDFRRLVKETWWSKEKPYQKVFIKRILKNPENPNNTRGTDNFPPYCQAQQKWLFEARKRDCPQVAKKELEGNIAPTIL